MRRITGLDLRAPAWQRVNPFRRPAILAGLCTLAWVLWMGDARPATDVAVHAQRVGSAVRIDAQARLTCEYDSIWNTLTDYDHLEQFIPGIKSSRILTWQGNEAIVEQVGEARFLFLRFPIEVTVGSESRPPDAIVIRVIKGNLRRLEGGYFIEPAGPGQYMLRWRGMIEPESYLPPLVGVAVLRANIEDQFLGMVREIERREGVLRGKGESGSKP